MLCLFISWTKLQNTNVQRHALSLVYSNGFIYAIGGHPNIKSVEKYSIDKNEWTSVAEMNGGRRNFGCAVLNGKIYVAGGWVGENTAISSVEVYDCIRDRWEKVKSMNTPRTWFKMIAYKGLLYVFGGYDGKERLNSVEFYNPKTNIWEFTTSMPKANGAYGIVLV